jgi:putative SOS response-associated peptidase YedK
MCGRMTQQLSPSDIARIFDAELSPTVEDPGPRYNCAPTDPLTVVLERDGGRSVETHRWGLIPAWAASPSEGGRMINARVETAASSPAFRVAFRRRRCIVPADGFYEWQRIDRLRQPYLIRRPSGEPLSMAGLWSLWPDPATGDWVLSCAVVTTAADERMAGLHDRMPALLDPSMWDPWLDPTLTDPAALRGLLAQAPAGALELVAVSTLVNSVRNEGPALIEPVTVPPPAVSPLFG